MAHLLAAVPGSWCGATLAIDLAATISRVLWKLTVSSDSESKGSSKKDLYRRASRDAVQQQVNQISSGFTNDEIQWTLSLMEEAKVCWTEGDHLTYRLSAHNPIALARHLFRNNRADHDLRYFVWRNIRKHYRFSQSAETAHHMHGLAAAINELMAARKSQKEARDSVCWDLHEEVLPLLERTVGANFQIPLRMIEFFLECCRAVNYMRVSDRLGKLDIRAQEIDSEFLLSQLFGIPTSMKGLDDLFGGGGLMLTEDLPEASGLQLGGRAVLTIGPFGTGKSLLALQMAVEVARKGGAAWFMPMEQSAEECLYSLETMGCLSDGIPVRIATTVPQAIELLDKNKRDPEYGALILIRTIKDSFTDFALAFQENARAMEAYSLRLIIVDPVSAITDTQKNAELRTQMLNMFESVKRLRTNVWLVSEDSDGLNTAVEQSISDTVIYLASEKLHGYSQRYIEIRKSRLQREQRGLHAFAIGPNQGFTVYPSSAAVRSKLQNRSVRRAKIPVEFGFQPIDLRLRSNNLFSGDVIVLQGPSGSGKTAAAMRFLLSPDLTHAKDFSDTALLLTNVEAVPSFRRQIAAAYQAMETDRSAYRKPSEIIMLGLPGGYVKPGFILQRLEMEFEAANFRRCPIARLVFDNIVNMELGCPFIAADVNFGETLVDLIRKHGTTSLFVCRESIGKERPTLQRAILNSADCLIQFHVKESKPFIEVRKSHGGRHDAGLMSLFPDFRKDDESEPSAKEA